MDVLLDATQLQSLKAEIEALPPLPHHAGILAVVQKYLPAYKFGYALNRGGWYRLGGVIRPDGTRLAHDLETWAESELKACAGDMEAFHERYAGDGLMATRLSGRGHYFVAVYGDEPAQFLQLEIEEVPEVLDRQLVDPDRAPSDLSELIDPVSPLTVPAQAVGRPAYRFRRLTDMQQALVRLPAAFPGQPCMRRFFEEWAAGSAAKRGHFCDHWIIALREYQDRYRNPLLSASPLSRHLRKLKTFPWDTDLRGVQLAEQIQAFDRAAGYTGAWYAHLVAGASTPRSIAFALGQDMEAGFSYLPDAEAALLRKWLASPYAV